MDGRSMRRALAVGVALAALIGCAGTTSPMGSSRIVSDATTDIYVGRCVFGRDAESPLLAAIVAPLIVAVIQEGVNLVANSLKSAGEGRTISSRPALGNFALSANQVPECVQIVRGRFYREGSADAGTPGWTHDLKLSDEAYDRMTKQGIRLSERPELFVEARLVRAAGTNLYTLTPHYSAFFKPAEQPLLSLNRSRLLSVAMEFRRDGSPQNPIAVSLQLERLIAGEVRCLGPLELVSDATGSGEVCRLPPIPAGSSTGPVGPDSAGAIPGVGTQGGSAPTGTATPALTPTPRPTSPLRAEWSGRRAYESSWFAFPSSGTPTLYTAQAVVTEVRDPNEFAAFLARVVEESKKDIVAATAAAARTALIPSERQAAETTRATAQEAARSAFATQLRLAQEKLSACASAESGSLALSQAARAARDEMLKANRLARESGDREAFAAFQLEAGAPNTLRERCASILQGSI